MTEYCLRDLPVFDLRDCLDYSLPVLSDLCHQAPDPRVLLELLGLAAADQRQGLSD